MKITLLTDYRGVLTNEVFYLAGEHDLPDGIAQALVDAGRAITSRPTSLEIELPPKPKGNVTNIADVAKTTRTKRTRKPKAK